MEMKGRLVIRKSGILKLLPFGEGFLFLDEAYVAEEDIDERGVQKLTAIKKIRDEECVDHFGIFPGHLLCEVAAQAAALLMKLKNVELKDTKFVLKETSGKFYRQVLPGETLKIEPQLVKQKMNFYFLKAEIFVGDETIDLFGPKEKEIVAEWEGIGFLFNEDAYEKEEK